MNYLEKAVERLFEILEWGGKDKKYILYPLGERGAIVKTVLNVLFGVREKMIIDNNLCRRYSEIYPVSVLQELDMTDTVVLITSDNPGVYVELRENLYQFVEEEKCIECFPNAELAKSFWEGMVKKQAVEKARKEDLCVYKPRLTNSLFWLPYFREDYIERTIFLSDNYFEIENLKYVITFHDGIIRKRIEKYAMLDIGSNIGNHTLFFANECNAKKIYCFEPMEEVSFIWKRNIQINNLENKVELFRCALGEKAGNATGKIAESNMGGTQMRLVSTGEIEVRQLDDFDFGEKIGFIKIDVEGMEFQVFKGGLGFLKRDMPYILCEIWEKNLVKVLPLMESIGYQWEKIKADDYLFWV